MLEDSTQRKFSCQSKETSVYSRAQMGQLGWQEKVKKSEHPCTVGVHPIKKKSTTMIFKEKRTDLIQQNNSQRMTTKPETISGVFLGIIIYRHHVQPRVKFMCQKKAHSHYYSSFFNVVSDGKTSIFQAFWRTILWAIIPSGR